MAGISLDQAMIVLDASLSHALQAGLRPLGVIVVDAGGHPIAYARQDGASFGRFNIALGKAAGALFLGTSTRKLSELAAERPNFVAAIGGLAPAGLVPTAGGVIVVDQSGSGIGAVGVSGDTPDNDEICARAGIIAAGLAPQD